MSSRLNVVLSLDRLKSDHIGIEITVERRDLKKNLKLKSDHIGIEIVDYDFKEYEILALNSDHIGIEI